MLRRAVPRADYLSACSLTGFPLFSPNPRQALAPDLCVTAAYGNYLPAAFLAVPPRGTLNIHPSLLPRYRGAAPVQRALEAGDDVTGVTVAFTVQAMDAGPVLAQRRVAVGPEETHVPLLQRLFDDGVAMLLAELPAVNTSAALFQI